MPDPNPAALEFLLSRRSRPAKTLTGPAPDRATLEVILTAAARTPDHGKLEPWRFIVLERAALQRLAGLAGDMSAAAGREPEEVEKDRALFAQGHLAVVVVASPQPSVKIPDIEQVYSAGAVCLSLLNAALAAGWGANWLSGWASHHPAFCSEGLGLTDSEKVAGLIFLGTETAAPPERPRPDLDRITRWVSS
ncbi:nitroreductase family protein [Chachezhania antarctica]|uniref:nitroreductase family protein n=1 Tax=Chachezhania antarctica TaxID=2340860 RepID=UPI000EB3A8E1|nr:nitroreductase [Chachezhania antarctica]